MEKQELNKQSSIEWLTQQALQWNIDTSDGSHYIKFPKNAFKQAKAMHKDECINLLNTHNDNTSEEHYNQTFNTKEK